MAELNTDQLSQLDSNIRAMLENGASQEDVVAYSNDYRQKYSVKKKDDTTNGTVKPLTSSNTESVLKSPKPSSVVDKIINFQIPGVQNNTFKPLTEQQKIVGKNALGQGTPIIPEKKAQTPEISAKKSAILKAVTGKDINYEQISSISNPNNTNYTEILASQKEVPKSDNTVTTNPALKEEQRQKQVEQTEFIKDREFKVNNPQANIRILETKDPVLLKDVADKASDFDEIRVAESFNTDSPISKRFSKPSNDVPYKPFTDYLEVSELSTANPMELYETAEKEADREKQLQYFKDRGKDNILNEFNNEQTAINYKQNLLKKKQETALNNLKQKYGEDINNVEIPQDDKDFIDIVAAQNGLRENYNQSKDLLKSEKYSEVNKMIQERANRQVEIDKDAKEDTWYKFTDEANKIQNVVMNTVYGLLNDIASLPRFVNGLAGGDKFNWTDRVADATQRFTDAGMAYFNTPTNLQRENVQDYAEVDGYKVFLDKKGNVQSIRDKDNFMVNDEAIKKQISQKYDTNKDKIKVKTDWVDGEQILNQSSKIIGDMLVMVAEGGGIGAGIKGAGKLSKSSRLLNLAENAKLTTSLAVISQMQNEMMNDAIDKGMSKTDAAKYAAISSAGVAAISLINPMEAQFLKNLKNIKSLASEEIASFVNGSTTLADLTKKTIKTIVDNSSKEIVEEQFTEPVVQNIVNDSYKSHVADGQELQNTEVLGRENLAQSVLTATTTFLPSITESLKNTNSNSIKMNILENPENWMAVIDKKKELGIIEDAVYSAEVSAMQKAKKKYDTLKSEVKQGDRTKLAGLIGDKIAIESKLSDAPELKPKYEKQLSEIETKISNLTNGISDIEAPIEQATDVNLQVDEFDDGKAVIDKITEKPIIEEPKDLAVEKPAAEMDNAQLDEIFETKIANPDAELDNIFSALPLKNKVDESQITPNELVNTGQEQDVSKGLSGEYQNDKGLQQELGEGQVSGTEVPTEKVEEKIKPIRQLGTGANVYFETPKYRVNDTRSGRVLLNINGEEDGGMAIANIEFDNVNEAVRVAERLQQDFPNGIPDDIRAEKYVEATKESLNKENINAQIEVSKPVSEVVKLEEKQQENTLNGQKGENKQDDKGLSEQKTTISKTETTENPIQIKAEEKLLSELVDDIEKGKKYDKKLVEYFSSDKSELFKKNGVPESLTKALGKKDAEKKAQSDKEQKVINLARVHNNIGKQKPEDKVSRAKLKIEAQQEANKLGWGIKMRSNGNFDIVDGKGNVRKPKSELTPEQKAFNKERKAEAKKWTDKINNFDFYDIKNRVLQYIATGGRIHTDDLINEVIGKGNNTEFRKKQGMHSKSSPRIDGMIENLLGVMAEDADATNTRNAIIEAFRMHTRASAEAEVISEIEKQEIAEGEQPMSEQDKADFEKFKEEQLQNEQDKINLQEKELSDTDQDVVEKIYNLEFSDKEAKDISDFLLKFKNLDGSIDWDGAIESLGSDFSLDLMSLSNGKIKEVTKIIEDAKGKREKQNESPTGEDIVVKDSVEKTTIGNEQQQGEQQAGTKQSTKRSADEIKTDIKTKSAELKALEDKQSKLNAQLEKNLQENQLDLLQGAKPQSMFDDKVEQQKVAESLKEEISQRRKELDKLKDEFDNINQGELELTGKELIGDALDRIVNKIGSKKNLTEQEKTTLTKDITDLAKGLLQEGKATLDNVIDKIKEAIKKRLPNLSEKDVKDLADTIKAKVATNRAIEILKDKGLTFEQAKAEFDKRNILYNEDDIKDAWDGDKKEKPKTENKPKGEVVEKTVLNQRVFKGEVSDELRRELKKHDLNRTTIPYHEARQIANDIIENVGLDTAFEAVERGDITGSPAAEIYNAKLEDLEKQINKETDADVLQDLIIEQARIFSELSDTNTKGGQFSSQMRYIYETSDIGYNVEKKISEWKEQFGEISPEVEQKFRDLDAQIKELNKQIVEAEQKAVEAEQKAILESIKASSGRKAKSTKVYGKDRVARGVDNLASLMGVKLSATGLNRPSLVKALTDIGVGLIEEGIATTENVVEKVKEYVKSKFGDKINVDDFADDINNAINLNTTQGKVKVPHSLIEKIVSEMDFSKPAIENFKLLVETVMEELGSKFPDATERDFRDAITNYGKIVNLNADEIAQQIRKLKRIGKIESALEDIRNKKRPLRSGQQRDKLDAEERAKLKELREAMKELPMDEETLERELKTQLDAEKTRVRNQIEDLQREIDKNELTPRNARTVREDAELKELKEKRDKLKEEHDAKFKDDDYKEKKRLELAKKTAEKKIEDLQRRIREGDFSKAVRKPLVADTELIRLKAQKLEAQEQYDKEFYKNKLKNRTKDELVKDSLWELWGITRALRATGEFSFVGVQGLINTIAHPMQSAKAFKNALTFFGSEKKTEDWLRKLKSQPYYPDLKASKLAITEPHAELNAREELFYSGWTNIIWNSIGTPLMLNKKAYEVWKNSNPFKAVERASVGYLDTIRVARYLDGVEMLKEKGITFNDNPQAYKEMADVINTFTGRGSIKFEALGGKQESSELLSKIFFSPKNWSSMIKTATPYALYHFGKKRAGAEAWKPSVAQKMALADFSKFVGFTTTILAMAAVHFNNDDDDEIEVELDPRSSDFGKIRIGKKYIDPWGGRIQQVILISKLISQSAKTKGEPDDKGKVLSEVLPLGIPYKTPTHENLLIRMALNKLSPSAQILDEYLSTTMKMNEKTGEYERNIAPERGGGKYVFKDQMLKSLYPIYWGTVADLYKDDPSFLNGLLGFYAFFGGGVNVYNEKEDKTTKKRSGLIQNH